MKTSLLGIASGGERRLRKAIELKVRQEHKQQLAAATDYWQKIEIEEEIQRAIKEQLKRVASPPILSGTDSEVD